MYKAVVPKMQIMNCLHFFVGEVILFTNII
jgi:hypothetical protein